MHDTARQTDIPRRHSRFAVAPTDEERERQEWYAAIDKIDINIQVTALAKKKFSLMLEKLEAGVGDNSMRITAPTGAGKSHIVWSLQQNKKLVAFEDEQGPIRPLLTVQAPSPCTLTTLAGMIYNELTGDTLATSKRESAAWQAALQAIHGQGVSILMIDEAHHLFLKRNKDERNSVAESLKNLILLDKDRTSRNDYSRPPIGLVLSGMPMLTNFVKLDGQLDRRAAKIKIDPVGNTEQGQAKIKRFIELVEPQLQFPKVSNLATADMVARFQVASSGFIGRVMALIKSAAQTAIFDGEDCIDRVKHLADAFEDQCEVPPAKNPFLVRDLAKCGQMPAWEAEERTLLRGKKPIE